MSDIRWRLHLKGYSSFNGGIPLGVDSTDHIAFFCPLCKEGLKIGGVETSKVNVNYDGGEDKCTWIILYCQKCKRYGQRKFYWGCEDGRFCWQTTHKNCRKQDGVAA